MSDQFETERLEAEAEADNPDFAEDETVEFVEYAGDAQYGTAFLSSHTIPKGDGLWKRNGVKMTKDLTWERDPAVPIGQKGATMRVPVEDIPADALKVLLATPGYTKVSV